MIKNLNLKEGIDKDEELLTYEKYIKEQKKEIYQKIILNSLYSLKLPQPIEHCYKKIKLSEFPNYSEKTIGQLLGKHGNNKQHFVNLTNVNLELDQNDQEAIILSKYSPADIEKATELIKKLLSKKSWTPKNMDILYKQINQEFDKKCFEEGSKIIKTFLKYENLPEEICKLSGMLKYSYSFHQNILEHSYEVAQISANIAFQLDLDPLKAKRAGFFHDIGKAIANYDDHVQKGLEIAKNANLDEYIQNAIESHHGKIRANNPYSVIIKAADKISASRFGARPLQIELIDKRKNMIQQELAKMTWIEKTILKNAGNLIQIFIKLKDFDYSKINEMKNEVCSVLRGLNSKYSYNYQIEFKMIYKDEFLLNNQI